MARTHGRFGQIYVGIATSAADPSPLPNVRKWSASFENDLEDATSFGDSNHVYVAGLPSGEGSFEGFWDSGTAQTYTAATDGIARKAYLYPTTPAVAGPYWYGTFFFSFDIDVDVQGVTSVKGNFRPSGTISKQGN